jgi:hypothetical protein
MKKSIALIIPCLFAAVILTGCASTTITQRETLVTGSLPRPGKIIVYDFASSPADIPANSAIAKQFTENPVHPTDEQAALGRQLGIQIAAQLVDNINALGMPAVQAATGAKPQINDIVIRGYLVSIDKGSTAKRMTIGFGSGGSELTTMVEGYQMTANGLRKLGSGTLGSESAKGPGASLGAAGWLITGSPVGLIVGGGMKVYGEASGSSRIEGRAKATAKEIADVLKQRFQEQGWIN